MKLLNIIKRKAVKRGIALGATLAVGLIGILAYGNATAGMSVRSGRDCDSNAVMYCGALSTKELASKYKKNSPGDIPAIYSNFGISAKDVYGLNKKGKIGIVHANGTVWADGQLIGVNAISAGRHKTTHSVKIPGSRAYKRPTSDSFSSPSTKIKVFIGYHGNIPSWGIITSCGNPLKWDRPDLDIQKQVSKAGTTAYGEKKQVKEGEKVTYKITVRETTKRADIKNVVVKDALPKGLTFMPNSLRINGKLKLGANPNSISLGTVKRGSTVTINFNAIAKVVGKQCGTSKLVNKATVTGSMQDPDSDTAEVTVSKECPPVYSCKSLTAIGGMPKTVYPGQTVKFQLAPGTVKHTKITGYTFKVNGEVKQNNANKAFSFKADEAGTYKITGYVKTQAGTTTESTACTQTVNVQPTPPPVITSCDLLSGPAKLKLGESADYKVTYTAENTTVENFIFTVDGKEVQRSNQNVYHYTPSSEGNHKVAVSVSFANGDSKTSADCQKLVEVEKVPDPIYICESLTLNKTSIKVNTTVTATVKVVVANSATLKSAKIDFSEGQPTTATVNGQTATATHKYTTTGNKKVTVQLVFIVDGKEVTIDGGENCAQTVTVNKEHCTIPGKEHLPKDDPECYEHCTIPGKEHLPKDDPKCYEHCTIPGKEHLPKGDPRCKTPQVLNVVEEIPNTGAGSMTVLMTAVTLLGAFAHRALSLRKQ